MSKVITLVVSAGSGGVRDYADIMANGLRKTGYDARVFAWAQSDANAIDAHIATSDCLYLQYSGYGFAKRGAPLWMLRCLQFRRAKIKRFGVFFHELYASGPPWGSAFWLSPLQRHVVVGLAKLADFWMTNRELSARWLIHHAPDVPNATLPVFSNVGELKSSNESRQLIALVFGSSSRRQKAWHTSGSEFLSWAKQNGLELHDVGAPMANSKLNATLERHHVIQHGQMDAREISRIMSKSLFGLVACPIEHVSKSGVFAAYCAHGIAPILASGRYSTSDGLEAYTHYLPASDFGQNALSIQQRIGESAWLWYLKHDIEAHATRTIDLIEQGR